MIHYFLEDTVFFYARKHLTNRWLKETASNESKRIGDLNIIFCSDSYILDINKKYLGHDFYTDIITFDYCEESVLSGDLFISVDTVRDNSELYETSFDDEIHRVIVHGLLHLIGYDDHTDSDKKIMRAKENQYLDLLKSMDV